MAHHIDPLAEPKRSALELQPRTTAAGLGGAVTTVAIVVAQNFGVDVTAELAAALATIFAAIFAWLPSHSR